MHPQSAMGGQGPCQGRAFGQYLLIVIIVVSCFLFFGLLRPQKREDNTNQKIALISALPRR